MQLKNRGKLYDVMDHLEYKTQMEIHELVCSICAEGKFCRQRPKPYFKKETPKQKRKRERKEGRKQQQTYSIGRRDDEDKKVA